MLDDPVTQERLEGGLEAPAAVWPGRHFPLGATWEFDATNFAVHAPEAEACWVCLFDEDGSETRLQLPESTLGIWHGQVPGVPVGTRYGFRAAGPWQPELGLRFDPEHLLLDPYARAISGPGAAHSVVVHDEFDWAEDERVRRRWRDTVIYELHVKGFTRLHDRIPEELRGTYAGLAHPVVTEYLTGLGVTAVELMPVHQFCSEPDLVERGLVNYWGYNSIGFFAPHAAYSSSGDRGRQVTEFKQMVKDLHAAGLEVILDVVYNHTAEGPADGPTLSFRGLDDRGTYRRPSAAPPALLDEPGVDLYWDATGCGNTVDTSEPHMLRLVLDSLRYWVTEMHVDGFRFDLLSALTRDADHAVDLRGQLLGTIGQDPVLREVKLIAEPWDATGDGYRLGEFPPPWVEWNDQFRDTMRDFWFGRSDGVRTVATRLAGSSDLYADDGRSPYASVNYVTAHDGFTVRDLVTYDHKHNEANGHDNRDGSDHERSWNCGVEGETDDESVLALRHRLAANLLLTLCLANGVPMLAAGDERGRTQHGNNNPYCCDNEISWVDWRPDDAWLDLYDLTRAALRIRREHPALRQRHWFEGRPTVPGGPKDLAWVHPGGHEMTGDDWQDHSLRSIGMLVSGSPLRARGPRGEVQRDASFLLWLNASEHPCTCTQPPGLGAGTVDLSTDPALPPGTTVEPESLRTLSGRALLLLRAS